MSGHGEQKWAAVHVYESQREAQNERIDAMRYGGRVVVVPWPPSGTLDREKAREALDDHVDRYYHGDQDDLLEALGFADAFCALVRPVPPQTIDRSALLVLLNDVFEYADYEAGGDTLNEYADAILALVRPIDGITLTPEEARSVLEWYDTSLLRTPEDRALARAIATRLGASS